MYSLGRLWALGLLWVRSTTFTISNTHSVECRLPSITNSKSHYQCPFRTFRLQRLRPLKQ